MYTYTHTYYRAIAARGIPVTLAPAYRRKEVRPNIFNWPSQHIEPEKRVYGASVDALEGIKKQHRSMVRDLQVSNHRRLEAPSGATRWAKEKRVKMWPAFP